MGDPTVSDEIVNGFLNGTFFDPNASVPYPLVNDNRLPDFNVTGPDMQIAVSEYTLNSLLYALYESDILTYTLHN